MNFNAVSKYGVIFFKKNENKKLNTYTISVHKRAYFLLWTWIYEWIQPPNIQGLHIRFFLLDQVVFPSVHIPLSDFIGQDIYPLYAKLNCRKQQLFRHDKHIIAFRWFNFARFYAIATGSMYNSKSDSLFSLMQMSLLSTPFIDNNDLFETGNTGGMSRDLINRIPKTTFSAATNPDQETDNCCAVCLQVSVNLECCILTTDAKQISFLYWRTITSDCQDFGASQFVRVLPHCQHTFHARCIDNWLFRHASCPLCRAGVHIDHIHM